MDTFFEGVRQTVSVAILTQLFVTVILFTIIYKFAYPAITKFVEERKKYIEESIGEAEKSREDAKSHLEFIEKEKQEIKTNRREILNDATLQAKVEANKIVDTSKEKAKSIIEKANQEIAQEEIRVQERLSKDTLELVAQASAKFLNRAIDDEAEMKMIEEAIGLVEDAN